jgi:hypothetical protein
MNINYISESENNEEAVENLSSALSEIFDIVNNQPMNRNNWNKIRRIIAETDLETNI